MFVMISALLTVKDIQNSISIEELIFSISTVFVTVILLIMVKTFGNIPISSVGIGTDLNLLTYGFLWDTCTKALRDQPFWPRLSLEQSFFSKQFVLLIVFTVNFMIMAGNFKLEHQIEKRLKEPAPSQRKIRVTNWLLKPFSVASGVFSLILFLFLTSMWG